MALINCPECGATVSDKAEKCPKCAFPLNSNVSTTQDGNKEVITESKEGCFLQTLNMGCMIVAGIILAAIFFAIMVMVSS